MNESSEHDDARMGHPDFLDAVGADEHGPAFEATFEGLDADDDTAVADG
jgi:hypothetical protein